MRTIKKTDKVLSISHLDGDGVASQIVLGNVFPNITYVLSQFVKFDILLADCDFSSYDHVILTDIYPTNPKLIDISDKIILIDHHDTALPFHNPSKMRFVDQDQCAAALTKLIMEKYFKVSLSHLDKFIYLINDYDLWIHKDPFSKDFNLLYEMYRLHNRDMSKYRERFMKGNVLLTDEEVDYIKSQHAEYNRIYNNVELVEFNHINGALVVNVEKFVNEICQDLMKNNGYNIVFIRNSKTGHINVRQNIPIINIGEILSKFDVGGGHRFAAGMRAMEADEFLKTVLELEKYLYTHYPEIRTKPQL